MRFQGERIGSEESGQSEDSTRETPLVSVQRFENGGKPIRMHLSLAAKDDRMLSMLARLDSGLHAKFDLQLAKLAIKLSATKVQSKAESPDRLVPRPDAARLLRPPRKLVVTYLIYH